MLQTEEPSTARPAARRSGDDPHVLAAETTVSITTHSETVRNVEGAVEKLEAEAFVRDEQIAALIHEIDQLNKAMDSRAAIEQAKGVLMATMRIGPDAAFDVLVAASQRENRKLREIAERLVASQEALPE